MAGAREGWLGRERGGLGLVRGELAGARERWLGLGDGNDGTGDSPLAVLVTVRGSKTSGRAWRWSIPPPPPCNTPSPTPLPTPLPTYSSSPPPNTLPTPPPNVLVITSSQHPSQHLLPTYSSSPPPNTPPNTPPNAPPNVLVIASSLVEVFKLSEVLPFRDEFVEGGRVLTHAVPRARRVTHPVGGVSHPLLGLL